MEKKKIGFISTRLAGSDGVSLETSKWAHVLEKDGHTCFYMAGELDTPPERSFLVPACHFTHQGAVETYDGCFGQTTRKPAITRKIEDMKAALKQSVRDFADHFDLDVLVPENALTIPLNVPLGLAITEFIAEHGFPIIAHHHDFYWERKRFLVNGCWDYLHKAFPCHFPKMAHVVLNSSQDHQLSLRTGISASIVPNVMDYANPPPEQNGYSKDLRETLGIEGDEKFVLQPTRIVKRKGIEHAIELVHRLGMPAKLVISHASGDEGDEYSQRVREYSKLLGVDVVMCTDIVGDERGTLEDGRKIYTLADLYHEADLVTYPSTVEGFGNAFLEAIYFHKPIVVNNYSIYNSDIKPKGFQTIEMDDYVSEETVEQARGILQNPEVGEKMARRNYRLAKRFFSYEVLRQNLRTLLLDLFGT